MADGDFDPQKIEQFFQKVKNSQNSWKFGASIIFIFLALAVLSSTFYTVQPEEVAVVQRFGKFIKTEGPGLHFKLPWGIDRYRLLKTQFIYKEEFGYNTAKAGIRSEYSRRQNDEISLMLTGDLNIADVEWSVQYRIQDPAKFLFNVRSPIGTLRDASETAMKLVIGNRSVDEVLTTGREEVNQQVHENLQEIMDGYGSGVKIVGVVLQDVNPPESVKDSFDDVNRAKQEKETVINQAREAYNKVIPKAKGEAEQLVSNAEGYASKRINEAEGDANRFLSVYRAYVQSPSVVKRRLYNETMAELLSKLDNVWVVDDRLKNMVPLLQMMGTPGSKGGKK